MASIPGIPEVIHDYNMYLSGSKLAGVGTELSLVALEAITEEVKGAGILGSYNAAVPGHYGSLEQEIPFRCVNRDYFRMIDPTKPIDLTLRAAEQTKNKANGALDYTPLRVVMRGTATKIELGTVKQAGPMDSKLTVELTYILIEIDGEKVFELDKLNGRFFVNGTDILAKVRKYT